MNSFRHYDANKIINNNDNHDKKNRSLTKKLNSTDRDEGDKDENYKNHLILNTFFNNKLNAEKHNKIVRNINVSDNNNNKNNNTNNIDNSKSNSKRIEQQMENSRFDQFRDIFKNKSFQHNIKNDNLFNNAIYNADLSDKNVNIVKNSIKTEMEEIKSSEVDYTPADSHVNKNGSMTENSENVKNDKTSHANINKMI